MRQKSGTEKRHVRELIKRGDFAHLRFGKPLQIMPSHVDEFERRNLVRPK
jgi:hypothetical protein